MGTYLWENSNGFGQVVAVDKELEVFSRAWCVAELVEADGLGISQSVKIHSYEVLDDCYDHLELLDVRDCKASRPEDKDCILSRIGNIDAFNDRLQWLIYGSGGLFSAWMDG